MEEGTFSIVIPARQGSKSILDKNIMIVNNHTLLEYTTTVAKKCNNIDNIFVSTDSKKYQELAIKYGVLAPFLRPEKISDDNSTDIEWFLNMFDELSKLNFKISEYWVWLRPTSPLRDVKVVQQAINTFLKDKNADSLRSVHPMVESPYKYYENYNNDYLVPFGLKDTGMDYTSWNKQNLSDVWIPNGYVDIVKYDNIVKDKDLFGKKIIKFQTNFTIEIDSQQELDFLNFYINKYGNSVFKN